MFGERLSQGTPFFFSGETFFETFLPKCLQELGDCCTFAALFGERYSVWALSSAGSEHLPYKQRVGGSNPSAPTRERSKTKWSCSFLLYKGGRWFGLIPGQRIFRVGMVIFKNKELSLPYEIRSATSRHPSGCAYRQL